MENRNESNDDNELPGPSKYNYTSSDDSSVKSEQRNICETLSEDDDVPDIFQAKVSKRLRKILISTDSDSEKTDNDKKSEAQRFFPSAKITETIIISDDDVF